MGTTTEKNPILGEDVRGVETSATSSSPPLPAVANKSQTMTIILVGLL